MHCLLIFCHLPVVKNRNIYIVALQPNREKEGIAAFSARLLKGGKMKLEDKFRNAVNYLRQSYYVNMHNIMSVGDISGPEPIVLGMLTGLLNGKMLLTGIPGTGKTTLSEAIGSICFSHPVDEVRASILHGHPEMTEEKMFGRPDLAALHRGADAKEEVIWSLFAQMYGVKIIDEINRLPASKQNLLLPVLEERCIRYLNGVNSSPEMAFFATQNYADTGNTALIPPLKDRFDVSAECLPFAGLVGLERKLAKNKEILRGEPPEFAFSAEDRQKFREKVYAVEEPDEFLMFLDFLSAETGYDPVTGVKIQGQVAAGENHYQALLSGAIKGSIALRGIANGPVDYMKAVAMLAGMSQLTPEIAANVLEYSLCHRLDFTDEAKTKAREALKDDTSKVPLHQYCARQQLAGVLQRYREQLSALKDINSFLHEGKQAEAAERLRKAKGTHPYFDCMLSYLTAPARNMLR